MNEILTVHPRQYRDAQVIAESFREGVPVIINLSQMSDGDARRLIDFASGLSQGLLRQDRARHEQGLPAVARARRGLGRDRRSRGRRRRVVLHARVAAVGALAVVWNILYTLLLIYFFVMWARFVLDLVRTFNRSWRPRGFWLVVVEAVYSVTDPPVRFFRRLVPPIRIGQVALDLGWSLAMLARHRRHDRRVMVGRGSRRSG